MTRHKGFNDEKKARILVGCAQSAYTRLFAILPRHELAFVNTITDARAALKAGDFNLIMIGLHFDESRMFDLVEYIRGDAKYNRVPVVCFRGIIPSNPESKQLALEGVGEACKAMGANSFFDLLAFPDDAPGNAAIRKMIHEFFDSERNA